MKTLKILECDYCVYSIKKKKKMGSMKQKEMREEIG